MNLTRNILAGLHGRLDIKVLRKRHPQHDPLTPLTVVGIARDGSRSGWVDVPKAFLQNKMLYFVEGPDGRGGWGREFIFADEVEVIDAPAGLVVEALLDLVGTHDPSLADLFARWYTAEGEREE